MKKIAASLVICGLLISNCGLAFADNSGAKIVQNANSIEIIKPDSDYTITTNDKIVVSGKGKSGSTVDLEVYTKKDGRFISTSQKKSIEIGPIGLFVSEVKLTDGENKIVFRFEDDSTSKIVKYIKIDDPKGVKKEMEGLKDKGITDIAKEILSTIK